MKLWSINLACEKSSTIGLSAGTLAKWLLNPRKLENVAESLILKSE
jgi:hypothetical protein